MYGLADLVHKENWAPNNWYFWIVVLESLESPLDCKEINQSIWKEINPEYSLEGLMLKMKPQYLGHLMWRAKSLEKTLMLGKIEGKRKRRQPRMRWLDSITDSMDMSLSKLRERVEDREARHVGVHGVTKSQTQLSDWTTAMLLTELSLLAREGLFDCFNWSGNVWQCSVWSVLCHKTACRDLVIHKESGTTLNSSPSALRKPITIVYETLILCFLVVSFNFLASPYALVPVSCSERLNSIFSFWGVITRAFTYWNILCVHDILRN